jgi:hypothetical protein
MCFPSLEIKSKCKYLTFYNDICGGMNNLKAAKHFNTYDFFAGQNMQKLGSKMAISIGYWIAIIEQQCYCKRRIKRLNHFLTIRQCFNCALFHMNTHVTCYLTW